EPVAKILLRLASIPINNFDRSAVMDVVTASFYRDEKEGRRARPDYWRLVVAALNITKGETEWARLAGKRGTAILEGTIADPEDSEEATPTGDPSQVAFLWSRVSRLIHDCRRLPARGSISELTNAFRALATSHLMVPGLTMATAPGQPDPTVGSVINSA